MKPEGTHGVWDGEDLSMRRAAIAIIRREDGNVLAVSRRDNLEDMGLPGGKTDEGETVEEGLIREVREEVGIHVSSFRPILIRTSHTYLVHVFEILEWEGTPTSVEGTTVRWMTPEELAKQPTFGTFNAIALADR